MQRVDAPEGHINGEDVLVLDPTGHVRGVFYPTPNPDEWQGGECLHYSKYVNADAVDDSMNAMSLLDDRCIAKKDEPGDGWYILARLANHLQMTGIKTVQSIRMK